MYMYIHQFYKYIQCTSHFISIHGLYIVTANDDGKVHVTAINPNPAVSTELLIEISGWMQSGATIEDVIDRLRTRTVPNGYSYRTWIPGIWHATFSNTINFKFFVLNLLIREDRNTS